MTGNELLETCRAIAMTFGRGTLSHAKDYRRIKVSDAEGTGTEAYAGRVESVLVLRPGIEPGREARSPGLRVRGTDAINADDIASDAIVLILKRKRRLGDAYVIDHDACRRAVLASYRHAMRSLRRESLNLGAPAWYYRCLMPAVPAVPERTEKHYGERPVVPKYVRIRKGNVIERDGGTVQEWIVTYPARAERPSYRSLRRCVPTDPGVTVLGRVCRGYARPTHGTVKPTRKIKETLEYAAKQGETLDARTPTVLSELSNDYSGREVIETVPVVTFGKFDGYKIVQTGDAERVTKHAVASQLGVHVRTVQRIVAGVETFVRECDGRHTDRYNRSNQLPLDPLPAVVPVPSAPERHTGTTPVLVVDPFRVSTCDAQGNPVWYRWLFPTTVSEFAPSTTGEGLVPIAREVAVLPTPTGTNPYRSQPSADWNEPVPPAVRVPRRDVIVEALKLFKRSLENESAKRRCAEIAFRPYTSRLFRRA